MMCFVFPEPGSLPGLPGTFAGCRVNLHEDGTYDVLPLPLHPAFEPEVTASPVPESAPPEAEAETGEEPVSDTEEVP